MCPTCKIRELNDHLRTTLDQQHGRVMLTTGVTSLPAQTLAAVLEAVKEFKDFGPHNDPHGEHDFGSVEVGDQTVFFKLDYYDPKMEYGSESPGDPAQTTRVLTIMLAEEY